MWVTDTRELSLVKRPEDTETRIPPALPQHPTALGFPVNIRTGRQAGQWAAGRPVTLPVSLDGFKLKVFKKQNTALHQHQEAELEMFQRWSAPPSRAARCVTTPSAGSNETSAGSSRAENAAPDSCWTQFPYTHLRNMGTPF